MSVINNGILLASEAAAAAGYSINRSLRFDSASSAYLSRTPGSAGNRDLWTLAFWIKRCKLGTAQDIFSVGTSGTDILYFDSSDRLCLDRPGATVLVTTQVFRDPSAWYHIVLRIDSTNGTNANKARLYVNGSEVTTFSTDNRSGLTSSSFLTNTAVLHTFGVRSSNTSVNPCDIYLADIYMVDGSSLAPSSFGETDATTGVWNPKTPTGLSYGTNGFRLPLTDNSGTTSTTLGKDSAGSNNWTPNNFSVASGTGNDSLVDSPTNGTASSGGDAGGTVVGNYCTWNPLNAQLGAGSVSNGNLDFTGPSGSANYNFIGGTFAIDTSSTSGWYFEITQATYGNGANVSLLDVGFQASALWNQTPIGYPGANSTAGISYRNDGYLWNYGTQTSGLTTWQTSGDVISIAIKDNKIWFAKNGTWISGSPSAGTFPSITLGSAKILTPAAVGINSNVFALNTGARPFAYAAPAGFKSLNTANLPTPTILAGNTAFDTKLYTGNGSTQTISGLGFSPDLVWMKGRSGATDHALYDAVRGAQTDLASNLTSAETTQSTGLTAFNSDGFSLGALTKLNTSSSTYAAWCWDAGSSTVTNTAGSITSTVRANASAGFSIVTYTGNGTSGATVGHGLGVAPSFFVVKRRNVADSWLVYTQDTGATKYLLLNNTTAASVYSGAWNNTAPTSTVFSLGNDVGVNASGGTYVCYAFAPVSGYSAMGSYVGNGSSDGVFVYTGFRSRWILIKRTDAAEYWILYDTARNTYNAVDLRLLPNTSGAEGSLSTNPIDILSNGFKNRGSDTFLNGSGATYIYAAFAENPFSIARAR